MRKVLLGTPAYDGRVDVWYAHSLVGTVKLCGEADIDLHPIFMSYDAPVQRARNDLIALALTQDCDDLLFVDSDQGWEPSWALALLNHPVDCVGAAVIRKTDDYEGYNVRATSASIPTDMQTGLWIVEAVGAGFLRLSRKAMKALWDASEEYTDKDQTRRMIFDVRIVSGRLIDEDVIMCAKLADAGIKVHLDPSFTVTHIGTKKFVGDFLAYVKRLEHQQMKPAVPSADHG